MDRETKQLLQSVGPQLRELLRQALLATYNAGYAAGRKDALREVEIQTQIKDAEGKSQ